MKNMAAFRLSALGCFYFALISLVTPFRDAILPTAVTACLLLVAALLAVQFEKPGFRLVFFLIPLVWIVLMALVDWPQLALTAAGCALPVLVGALTLALRREQPELWRCRREFLVLTGATALLLILSLNPLIYSANTCIFLGAFLLLGILALRAGRAGQTKSARWQAGSAGFLLLPILCAAGLGTALMVAFDALMAWLKNLFADAGMEVARPTAEPLLVDHHWKSQPLQSGSFSTAVPYDRFDEPSQPPILVQGKALDWKWILLGLVLLLAVIVLLRLLLGNRKQDKDPEEPLDMVLEEDGKGRGPARRRRRQARETTNAAKVRELYRQYLSYLRMKGVSLEQSETSADVSEEARAVTGDDAVLREIYRQARYDHGADVTDEQLQQAQAAYHRLTHPDRSSESAE